MAEHLLHGRKTIAEVISMGDSSGLDESICTVMGRVDSIYPYCGWFYVTCSKCSKEPQYMNHSFFCNICDETCSYPMIRYRIHMYVSDETGRIMVTIYNKVAEKLLDSAANKFFNFVGYEAFPLAIPDLVGRSFSFRIRLPNYAKVDTDFHNHIVVSMLEVDPSPLLQGYDTVQVDCSPPSMDVVPVESGASSSSIDVGLEVTTPVKTSGLKKRQKG